MRREAIFLPLLVSQVVKKVVKKPVKKVAKKVVKSTPPPASKHTIRSPPRPAAHAFRLRTMRAEVVKKVVKKAIKKAPVRKAQRGKSYASMQRDGKGPFDDIYKLAGDFVQAFGALGKK